MAHGEEEAERARDASRELFGGQRANDGVPTSAFSRSELEQGIPVPDAFQRVGLAKSRSEARRLIRQGGAYVNGDQVSTEDRLLTTADLQEGSVLLRAGRKRYHRVTVGPGQ